MMKSIFQICSMPLQGDGLYTALLIKVLGYLLPLRLQAEGVFSQLTTTEIIRKWRREEDFRECLSTPYMIYFQWVKELKGFEQGGIIS
jgi:hypothetical protein